MAQSGWKHGKTGPEGRGTKNDQDGHLTAGLKPRPSQPVVRNRAELDARGQLPYGGYAEVRVKSAIPANCLSLPLGHL
jgi:hypothetical protein